MIPSDLMTALHQESFVHILREELMATEKSFETSDRELLLAEAKQEFLAGRVASLKQEIEHKEAAHKSQEQDLFAKRKIQQQFKRTTEILFDYQSLFAGTLFHGSNAGARFFTLDLKSFAYAKGYGEMVVEDSVCSSLDGLSLVIDGKRFWYLRATDGALYFHPHALSENNL